MLTIAETPTFSGLWRD